MQAHKDFIKKNSLDPLEYTNYDCNREKYARGGLENGFTAYFSCIHKYIPRVRIKTQLFTSRAKKFKASEAFHIIRVNVTIYIKIVMIQVI